MPKRPSAKPKTPPLERARQMRARADALEKRTRKTERARRTRLLIIAGSYFETAGCLDAWEALTEEERKIIAAHLPMVIARAAGPRATEGCLPSEPSPMAGAPNRG